jgi:hypothetical protein
MNLRLTAGAAVLSLGLGLGAAVATPASAQSLAQGKPYGCQISSQVCATPEASQPPPSFLPQTGGAANAGGLPINPALPVAGLALTLAGIGVRRVVRRR